MVDVKINSDITLTIESSEGKKAEDKISKLLKENIADMKVYYDYVIDRYVLEIVVNYPLTEQDDLSDIDFGPYSGIVVMKDILNNKVVYNIVNGKVKKV